MLYCLVELSINSVSSNDSNATPSQLDSERPLEYGGSSNFGGWGEGCGLSTLMVCCISCSCLMSVDSSTSVVGTIQVGVWLVLGANKASAYSFTVCILLYGVYKNTGNMYNSPNRKIRTTW